MLAAVVRFYRLTGRSLWLDETVTAQSAHLNSAGDVIAQSQVYVNQAPLFYLITWLLRPWGDGEFVLRLPAAVAGTLTVVAVYLVGRRLFGSRGALIAALLTAVMAYAVWYSQEARNYSLFMLFTTMQIYFAFNAVTRSRRLDWLGLALFTTLDLYTHYLAIAATAGVVVYVALFLGADTLRGTSNRTKAVTAAAVGAAALLAALVARRAVLKAIYLAAQSILARAQMHRVYALLAALAISAALIVFGAWLRKRLLLRLRPELVHKLEWAIVATVLVALAYAPWLPYLRLALSRPDVTVGLLHPTHQPGLNDILSMLDRLSISGFLLLFFVLGLLALFVGLFRGRPEESALLICTLLIPVLVLVFTTGPAIVDLDTKYLAFLFPSAVLVIAAGVQAASLLIGAAIRRFRHRPWPNPRIAAAAPALVLLALLLVQAVPALAASYQTPKQDYRAAAEHIASSRPAPVLLSLGNYSDWSVITFGYYFNQLHVPFAVVEGQLVTSKVASTLAGSTGTVWGVVIFPSAEQLHLLTSPGVAQVDFVDATHDVYLVRAADRELSPAQQARALLSWEAPVEPRLRAAVKLMDYLDGQARLGPDLVSDPTAGTPGGNGWTLQPGVSVAGDAVVIAPSAATPELYATSTVQVQPGADYVVSFQYLNDRLSGSQRVDAIAIDSAGHEVTRFPGGNGFECTPAGVWTDSAFAFEAPGTASAITLFFRARGTGIAQFRAVHFNSISESL